MRVHWPVMGWYSRISPRESPSYPPIIRTLRSMFAPLRPQRGFGSSPVRIQVAEFSLRSSVEESFSRKLKPPVTRNVLNMNNDTTRITINIYLGPIIIIKEAAAMIKSALHQMRKGPQEAGLGVLGDSVEGVLTSSQDYCLTEVDGAGLTSI